MFRGDLGGGEYLVSDSRAHIGTGMMFRPAILASAAAFVTVVSPDESAKWPYGLVALAGAVGLYESNLLVYRLLHSPLMKRGTGRYLQVCALWMVILIVNLTLLNLAAHLSLPNTFKSDTGLLSSLDILYFTILTFASGGYGDVIPATPVGKALSIVTTLFGFFYASTLCAAILQQISLQRRH